MIKLKVEKVDLYSNILEKEMSMLVYLPTTYNHLDSLPVLYFLHQRRGDENIMFEIDIHTTADRENRADDNCMSENGKQPWRKLVHSL